MSEPTRSFGALPRTLLGAAIGLPAACGAPLPPPEPTWADVEPILRANCNHCHGATAEHTGSAGGVMYRFDFYDLDPAICGEAATAMPAGAAGAPLPLGRSWATLMKSALTATEGTRPRMPPAPAATLSGWQRETLVRWADQLAPRGKPPEDNKPATIQLSLEKPRGDRLSLHGQLQDPDGEPVLGVVRVGTTELRLDRSGAFRREIDVGGWADGSYPVSAVLCDGWVQSRPPLAPLSIGEPVLVVDVDAGEPDPTPPSGGQTDGGAIDGLPEAPAARCPDLDGNGKLDCDETVLVNASFDEDLRGWTAEPNVGQSFVARDARNRPGSGALAVTNATSAEADGGTMGGSRQCLDARGGARYRTEAQVLVEGGQPGNDPLRAAAINVQFWSAPGCLGELVHAFTTPLAPESPADVWRKVGGTASAPTSARSMAVRLVAAKSYRGPPFRVLMDNVLLRTE